MSAASYFALKYLSFTLTLHLAESDTRYEDQIYSFPSMTLLLSLTVVYSEKKGSQVTRSTNSCRHDKARCYGYSRHTMRSMAQL